MARAPLELVQLTAEYLGRKGIDSPRLDAEVLLAHVLGVPRIQLYVQFDKPLEQTEVDRYRDVVRRRAGREPVAHITGVREFWSLELVVNDRVLVPRPETEVLVEGCLRRMGSAGRLVDLGTGSGAIGLALLAEQSDWTGVAVDCSPEVLQVAGVNARKHKLEDRLALLLGDLFEPVAGQLFDLVVSNPPYIPSGQIQGLAPEVARFDPRQALDGGADGLEYLRRIAALAPNHLRSGGTVAVEFGVGQERRVAELFTGQAAYRDVELLDDYAGRPRIAMATRR